MERPQIIMEQADDCLRAASYNPRRLVLIHSGAALGFSLLLTVINFIIAQGIGSAGGLSGIGTRAVLGTIQTVLQYLSMLLLPFWQIGFAAAALAMARKQPFGPQTLLKGFSRIFPVIGLLVAQSAVALVIGFVCLYACSGIFMVTPLAQPFMDILTPVLEDATLLSGGQIYLDEATLLAATDAMLPLLIGFFAVYLLIMFPVSYRFRMASFIVMDDPGCGGIRAMIASFRMMRRNCMDLFRLDLWFWWFYALQALAMVVGAGDMLLPLLGVELPGNTDVLFFLCYILQLIGQLALFVWAKAKVQTAYALVYEQVKAAPAPQPRQEQPVPKNLPWDYE